MRIVKYLTLTILFLGALGVIGWLVAAKLMTESDAPGRRGERGPAPVEAALIERGPIEQRRVFSGTLEATSRITVAPKIAGRIAELNVDLADLVRRDEVIARLDDAEFEQASMQAEAELAVARAGLNEARSAAKIAEREMERVRTLHERGVASDAQLDEATASELSRAAAVAVAEAQVTRAEAALEASRIRLDYATIRADWDGGDDERIVGQRFVEEGDTVAANTPLVSIIELDPIRAVIFATEREYALLESGQQVTLATDAYPGRSWEGRVSRVSPVFEEGSRQARVEILVPNASGELKPGMFARVTAILKRIEDARIVPVEALVERGGETVVFIVDASGETVSRRPVRVGVRENGRVEIIGDGLDGRVVTLGQQLIGDGAAIVIPADIEADDEGGA